MRKLADLQQINKAFYEHLMMMGIIGGSNSKLKEFLRKCKAEKQLAIEADEDISDALRQAPLAEFGWVI